MTDNTVSHKEKARELFLSGRNCSQAVLEAFGDVTGLDADLALRLSSSFGGGMGRMREVCGCCSAMFMIAGILYGYSDCSLPSAKSEHYALIQRIAGKFKAENGSIICRELLGKNNPGSAPQSSERNAEFYKKRPCLEMVECAADIMDSVIAEQNSKTKNTTT